MTKLGSIYWFSLLSSHIYSFLKDYFLSKCAPIRVCFLWCLLPFVRRVLLRGLKTENSLVSKRQLALHLTPGSKWIPDLGLRSQMIHITRSLPQKIVAFYTIKVISLDLTSDLFSSNRSWCSPSMYLDRLHKMFLYVFNDELHKTVCWKIGDRYVRPIQCPTPDQPKSDIRYLYTRRYIYPIFI